MNTSQSIDKYEFITFAKDQQADTELVVYRDLSNNMVYVDTVAHWQEYMLSATSKLSTQKCITNLSPNQEKISLYKSLFIGRNDVYAVRWESRKTGKTGYSPACVNQWQPGKCQKPQCNCNNCPYKQYIPFDEKTIAKHLKGEITVGIYPLLENDECKFLVIDFDEERWQEEIVAVCQTARRLGINSNIERSRSGNGGHLWIFFEECISAATARKLGTYILAETMSQCSFIKFSSFDRFFPNQDTIPKGGLGNLIALPLQAAPRHHGNSVFADESLKPYTDQWSFLGQIEKTSLTQVEAITSKLSSLESELYQPDDQPWIKKSPATLEKTDFPKQVKLVKSNLIFIPKQDISQRALTRLKRMATFKNPEFFRAQAMRMSVYGKPRYISTAQENSHYLGLPRGLMPDVIQLFQELDIDYQVDDKTEHGRHIDISFTGELKPEQKQAREALLVAEGGVLSATTAFGKTVVAISIIAALKVNTLIIVHRTSLLQQWRQRLSQFLQINEKPPVTYTPTGRKKKTDVISAICGTKKQPSGIIDVAVMQSLIKEDNVNDLVKNYGLVIVDECHHVSAFTFERILQTVTAKFVYGLTATPTRRDGHQAIINFQCGPIVYQVNKNQHIAAQNFAHYFIPVFTSFHTTSENITQIYGELAQDAFRNQLIISDCRKAVAQGRTPIILTERTTHVELLAKQMSDLPVITLTGKASSKQKKEIHTRLQTLKNNESVAIIATGKYIGEGFDFPRLDTLLLAMPVSWRGTLEQYVGRLHREHEGKTEVRVYDYVDLGVPALARMYQKRLSGYRSLSYQIKTNNEEHPDLISIFDDENYLQTFMADLQNVHQEVVISSPLLSITTIKKLLPVIKKLSTRMTIVTNALTNISNTSVRQHLESSLQDLTAIGVNIQQQENLSTRFCVIDRRLVWFGDINLLGKIHTGSSAMRWEDQNVAAELLASAGNLTKKKVLPAMPLFDDLA